MRSDGALGAKMNLKDGMPPKHCGMLANSAGMCDHVVVAQNQGVQQGVKYLEKVKWENRMREPCLKSDRMSRWSHCKTATAIENKKERVTSLLKVSTREPRLLRKKGKQICHMMLKPR